MGRKHYRWGHGENAPTPQDQFDLEQPVPASVRERDLDPQDPWDIAIIKVRDERKARGETPVESPF